jgi:pimeloyl-ACP methyl ester carboxylesterase
MSGRQRQVEIVDKGSGAPLVLIQPLQGRWEYLSGTVDALARSFRVITFSLCGERGSGMRFDRRRGLANYVSQTAAALDDRGIQRAIVCGISFGGVVALQFAAAHPQRTAALILASTPGPHFHLRRRHAVYARLPWIFGPLFLAEIPRRFRPEFAAAMPDAKERRRFAARQLSTFVRAPVSLRRMAQRARLVDSLDLDGVCARIEGSTDYLRLIAGAKGAVLERTGHHGTITRPHAFAALVQNFVNGHGHAAA